MWAWTTNLVQQTIVSVRLLRKSWMACTIMPSPADVQFWWMWTDIADSCTLLRRMLLKVWCCYKPYRHRWTPRATKPLSRTCKKIKQSHYRPWGLQKVEAPRFKRNRHMKVVRLSAIRTDRLCPQEIFLVVPISGWGWVKPRTIVRPEGLCQWKIPVTPWGSEPATFRLEAQCLNQQRYSADTIIFWKKSPPCERFSIHVKQICIYWFMLFFFFIRICRVLCASMIMTLCAANCVQLLSTYGTAISKNKEIRCNVMMPSHFVAPCVDFLFRFYIYLRFDMCRGGGALYWGLRCQDHHVNRNNYWTAANHHHYHFCRSPSLFNVI
jgi:hypothetical protein